MKKLICILALCLCLLTGCPRRSTSDKELDVFKHRKSEHVLALVIDMSSSFAYSMQEDDPRAFQFVLNVIDKFKRERAGHDDRIVIAQLSGNKKKIRGEGSPRNLKKAFSNKRKFKKWVRKREDEES